MDRFVTVSRHAPRLPATPTRALMLAALAVAAGLPAIAAAQAPAWPAKPVRVIFPYPPGGGTDAVGRIATNALTEQLGQTFVVDTRPGASGQIGTEVASKSPADGYTLVLGNVVLWKAWRAGRAVTLVESKNLYRCLQWGTVLMAAGTLLGAVWADQAWGRFWGWDPKEVGALIILLVYLIPLHLRYVGSVGPTGLAAWAVLGFLSVVWSWYGVNFILGAGLHAYAFGNGGQHIVLPLAALQVVLTTWQLVSIKRALKAGARERGSEGASAGAEPPRAPGLGE